MRGLLLTSLFYSFVGFSIPNCPKIITFTYQATDLNFAFEIHPRMSFKHATLTLTHKGSPIFQHRWKKIPFTKPHLFLLSFVEILRQRLLTAKTLVTHVQIDLTELAFYCRNYLHLWKYSMKPTIIKMVDYPDHSGLWVSMKDFSIEEGYLSIRGVPIPLIVNNSGALDRAVNSHLTYGHPKEVLFKAHFSEELIPETELEVSNFR